FARDALNSLDPAVPVAAKHDIVPLGTLKRHHETSVRRPNRYGSAKFRVVLPLQCRQAATPHYVPDVNCDGSGPNYGQSVAILRKGRYSGGVLNRKSPEFFGRIRVKNADLRRL